MFAEDVLDLRKWYAFHAYTDDELRELKEAAEIADRMPGEFICREGAAVNSFFVLCGGRAEVVRDIDGERKVLAQVAPGSMFGQMALLRGTQRIASVVCSEPCVVMELSRDRYHQLQRSGSALGLRLHLHNTISAVRQLRRATKQLMLVLIRSEAGEGEARLEDSERRKSLVSLQVALTEWGVPVHELAEPDPARGEAPMSDREAKFRTTGKF